ncbi:hypothetical protein TorRG33x02_005530 [Trema orientale]|uniref:Uncharacterized protein n=1 Tax=Trema orientale TaxID=63057 RepID=A0A2P5FZW6_TREOI|nr:hypothetical protein TorRG33x02_005530 [Trema orientale]
MGVPIFADTNLDTRIVMAVPPDITAGDFKRKIESVHFKCFPGSGEIKVCGLMVKKKSCFYYLPDSIPMKYAFQGVRGTWFLHVEARTSSEFVGPYLLGSVTENNDLVSVVSDICDPLEPENLFTSTDKGNTKGEGKQYQEIKLQNHDSPLEEISRRVYVSKKKKKSERKECFLDYKASGNEMVCIGSDMETAVLTANMNCNHSASVKEVEPQYQQASISMTEAPSEMFSEVKSVTSIIRRYFPDSNESNNFSSPASSDVTSKIRKRRKKHKKTKSDDVRSSSRVGSFPKSAGQSPSNLLPFPLPSNPSQGTLKGTINRPQVGKRLLMASNNLGSCASKKKSVIYFCRSRDRTVFGLDSPSVKWSVFEISDSDD